MSKLRYALAFIPLTGLLAALSIILYEFLRSARLDLPGTFVRMSMYVLLGFLILLILRYSALLWFSFLSHLEQDDVPELSLPLVTILVPAYNEGAVIQGSIRSLLHLDYPAYEVIIIDDGSSDDTYVKASAYEGQHGHVSVRVITRPNGGKSRALNSGIEIASGEMILCMDGDSTLHTSTLRKAVRHLVVEPDVAAVAGSVKVVNRSNMLTRLQALEYIEGLNMVRAAQGFFRLVNIIPGPIGLFRKSVLQEIGGYDHDTFAEDCDLTLKLLRAGWQVKYEPAAIAFTEAPERVEDLLKQRYRWTRGILQAIKKHKRPLIDPRQGIGVSLTLWFMVFEGILWPVMNVFAHVIFIFTAVRYGTAVPLVIWFAQLTILDLAAALYCIVVEREELMLVPYAVCYRAFFALTVDVTKVLATAEELLALKMDWGKLERIGRI